jgi:putative transposase
MVGALSEGDGQLPCSTCAPTTPVRHSAHVARLYPTCEQNEQLEAQGHTARALWNLLHEWYTWGGHGRGIARRPCVAEIDRQLRAARTDPPAGWEWLAQLPAQATQQVLKHYLGAWDRFFAGRGRPPTFKRRAYGLAVDVPQASQLRIIRLNRRLGEVSIPLIGRVRFSWTRSLPGSSVACPGRITGARLIRDRLGWHICFRIEQPVKAVPPPSGPPVGIDRGVVHTMALSDGRDLDMPPLLSRGEERRLRKLQRQSGRQRAARMQGTPMSARELKTYHQIGALRAQQARRRKDWLHKVTTALAKNHGMLVVEDLHVRRLTGSARGTVEVPGRNVKAKAGLNRSILGMAWGKAGHMLSYKALLHGGVLVSVPAPYSSQTCADCGLVAADSRRSRDWFRCIACGHQAPADTNAARVLLSRGLATLNATSPGHGVAGRGAFAAGQAVKRQPSTGAVA